MGKALAEFPESKATSGTVGLSMEGNAVVYGKKLAIMWDFKTGKGLGQPSDNEPPNDNANNINPPHIGALAISPNDNVFAEGENYGTIRAAGRINIRTWNGAWARNNSVMAKSAIRVWHFPLMGRRLYLVPITLGPIRAEFNCGISKRANQFEDR